MQLLKKIVFAQFLSIAVSISAIAQLKFWNPDGTRYKRECVNINDINKDFDFPISDFIPSDFQESEILSIGFKAFTNEPVWLLADDSVGFAEAIAQFDLKEYLDSWSFEFDLERYVKKRQLSDYGLLQCLGAPDSRVKYVDQNISFENWTYDRLSLQITLQRGIAVSFIKSR